MAIIGSDSFTRANQSGFGTASDGQAWDAPGGMDSYAIVGNEGTVSGATGASGILLGAHKSVNGDVHVRCSRATSANSATGVEGRVVTGATYYKAMLTGGLLELVAVVANVQTTLATASYSVTLGAFDSLRLLVSGNQLFVKAWADPDGNPDNEPPTWNIGPITDNSVQGTGQFGLYTLLASGDTASYDTFSCDDLSLPAPGWLPENPYGLTFAITNKKTPPAPYYPYWSQLFTDMQSIGLTKARVQISFNLIWTTLQNPSNPTLDNPALWSWGPLDDAVAQLNAEQVPIIFPIRSLPTWALTQQATTEPFYLWDPTISTFIAGAVATRYNGVTVNPATGKPYGLIQWIELGNEDFNIHFTPSGQGYTGLHNSPYSEYNGLAGVSANVQPARDPHFFVQVLAGCSAAIRAASPQTKVLMGAVWWRQYPNVADFLRGIYVEGGAGVQQLFDAVNLHFYSTTSDPTLAGVPNNNGIYTPSLLQALNAMYAVMTQYGDFGKRIKITEIGWSIGGNTPNTTPAQQAAYFTECYEIARQCGFVDEFYFFTIDYSTQNRASPPGVTTQVSSIVQWSISAQAYVQEPAYAAIQAEIAAHPTWQLLTYPSPTASIHSAAGNASLTAGHGQASLTSAAREASLTSGRGDASLTSGSGNASMTWEA